MYYKLVESCITSVTADSSVGSERIFQTSLIYCCSHFFSTTIWLVTTLASIPFFLQKKIEQVLGSAFQIVWQSTHLLVIIMFPINFHFFSLSISSFAITLRDLFITPDLGTAFSLLPLEVILCAYDSLIQYVHATLLSPLEVKLQI